MVIKGFRVGPLLRKTLSEIREDRVLSLAAETAYYFFFSLFPLLLFLTPLLGLLGNTRQLMSLLLARLSGTLPPDTLSLLQRTVSEIMSSRGNAGVMSIGVLLAGWSGTQIFGSLMEALNVAYDATETRPWWKQYLTRLAALLVAGIVVLVATAVLLDGEGVTQWIARLLHLGPQGAALWTAAQVGVALSLLVLLGAALYKYLPDVRQSWGHVLVASTVATVLWLVVTILFRLYVQHFGAYNKTYGTIGGVIVLLSWMYYSMLAVLVGGELASEIAHGTGAVEPERGATYLGRIVSVDGPDRASLGAAARRESQGG